MKLLQTLKVKIGDKVFPIKAGQRALHEYENMSGETFYKCQTSEKRAKLLYCAMKQGARAENKEFAYSYEQFLDLGEDYAFDVIKASNLVLSEYLTQMDATNKREAEEDKGKKLKASALPKSTE